MSPFVPPSPIRVQAEVIAIDSVEPYPANPRRGDVAAIAESLTVNGQYRPIVVNRRTNQILAGNHTWKAAKSLRWKKIAATFVDVDDAEARRMLIADNRTQELGTYDDSKLTAMLDNLPSLDGSGFMEQDRDRLDSLLDDINITARRKGRAPGSEVAGYSRVTVALYRMWLPAEDFNPWVNQLVDAFDDDEILIVAELKERLGMTGVVPAPTSVAGRRLQPRLRYELGDTKIAMTETTTVPCATLTPYPGNARQGDVGAIAESLRVNGQFRPIVVNRPTNQILVGNHTWAAAVAMGWDDIAVTYVDVDPEAAARIVLADNRTADLGSYDNAQLVELLTSLTSFEGTGFDGDDVDELIRQTAGWSGHDSGSTIEAGAQKNAQVEIGVWKWRLSIADWDAWHDQLRGDVGYVKADIVKEILNRLGLGGADWLSEAAHFSVKVAARKTATEEAGE